MKKKLDENGELIIKIDEFHFTSFHLWDETDCRLSKTLPEGLSPRDKPWSMARTTKTQIFGPRTTASRGPNPVKGKIQVHEWQKKHLFKGQKQWKLNENIIKSKLFYKPCSHTKYLFLFFCRLVLHIRAWPSWWASNSCLLVAQQWKHITQAFSKQMRTYLRFLRVCSKF